MFVNINLKNVPLPSLKIGYSEYMYQNKVNQ